VSYASKGATESARGCCWEEGEWDKKDWPDAAADRLHGRVGLKPDGTPGWETTPYPKSATPEMLREFHKGYCFNNRYSDSLPMDRHQKDMREHDCKRDWNSDEMLPGSVVIIFFNEGFSPLMRAVHSILNRSPPHLLREVVLVDDGSDRDTHPWLFEKLDAYVPLLPKTRMVRLPERRGLMAARTAGAEATVGDVTLFLDSHIEVTDGYLEPLLHRVTQAPKAVVVPAIDSIDFQTFQYMQGGIAGALGFHWRLGQEPVYRKISRTKPTPSPIMAGGLLALRRDWFFGLGAYDPEMHLYGGEEMEISFRIWQCGGTLELIACSHIGHIFRNNRYWQGQVFKVDGSEITRNKLRAAAVWMDEYEKVVQLSMPVLPQGMDLGDLSMMRAIREKYQCKSFKWYLENIYPEIWVPPIEGALNGNVKNLGVNNACIDTLGGSRNSKAGAYPCHHFHGTQAFLLGSDGHLRIAQLDFKVCLGPAAKDGVMMTDCTKSGTWTYDKETKFFKYENGLCLRATTAGAPFALDAVKCTGEPRERWEFTE